MKYFTTNYKTIYINNLPFSIEKIDEIVEKQVPGKYKIVWKTPKNIWEMRIKWNGKTWKDLHIIE